MRTLIAIFLLISPVVGFSQVFEGKITYANSYKSKLSQLTDQQLETMMGTTQNYYIKGANYKSIFNGTFIKMHLYRSAENKSYSLTANSDSLYSEDYSKNNDVATKSEVGKAQETVSGILCNVLIIYTPKGKTTYYYNSKYGVNPVNFSQHRYGNWYYLLSKTKALPLKIISENEQFTLISIAVSITPMKLEETIFTLPDSKLIAPARW
jgi:hypothetical protein